MDGEPVITLDQLDSLIAGRIAAEAPRTCQRAERAHSELVMASREPSTGPDGDTAGGQV